MRVLYVSATAVALAVAPAALNAQAHGQFQWQNAGNTFANTYKRSNNSTISVLSGGAYRAKFSGFPVGGSGFGPTTDIFCVDFTHNAWTGAAGYGAWFTRIGTDPLTKTRSSSAQSYLKAAVLAELLITKTAQFASGGLSNAEKDTLATIHGAIWKMMSGEPVSYQMKVGGTWNSALMDGYITYATNNWQNVNANNWVVVTHDCVANGGHAGRGHTNVDGCSQEFLTHNVVPEPATMILLGTGLLATLAMSGLLRRPPEA